MLITACIKNMKTISLPQICSPVALIIKDKKGLANHPLSCHPQRVFDKRESERNGEKMREKKIGERAERFRAKNLLYNMLSCLYNALTGPYMLLKTRKITKRYEIPIVTLWEK